MKKLLFSSLLAFTPWAITAMEPEVSDALRIIAANALTDFDEISAQIADNRLQQEWLQLDQSKRDEKYFELVEIIKSKNVSEQEKAQVNLQLAKAHLAGYGIQMQKDNQTLICLYLKCAAAQNDDLKVKEEAEQLLGEVTIAQWKSVQQATQRVQKTKRLK